MSAGFSFSPARQNLAALLDQALSEMEVRIKRKKGRVFVIRPEPQQESPLDSQWLNLIISTAEVVPIIREGRGARTDK